MKYTLLSLLIYCTRMTDALWAEAFLKKSSCPETINLTEEANWPPFTREASGIATIGLSYDLMNLIFRQLGCKVKIHLYPQERMLKLVREGHHDAVTAISKSSEREEFLLFLETPLLSTQAYVYYNQKNSPDFVFRDWKSLKKLKVGIVRGHNYTPEFEAAKKSIPLDTSEVANPHQLFEMLKKGRVNVILASEITAREILKDPKYRDIIINSPNPFKTSTYYMAISKKSPLASKLPSLNQVMVNILKNGQLDNTLRKHGL